jgi:hypothetical protein
MVPVNSSFHNENNFLKNYLNKSFTSPVLNQKNLKDSHMSWVGPGPGRSGVGILK